MSKLIGSALSSSRLRRFVPVFVAGIVLSFGLASSASAAQIIVNPSVSGSGAIAGGAACTGALPNGGVTPCGAVAQGVPFDFVPTVMVLVAVPQATPAGHWSFTRWEGCPIPSANQCTIVASGLGVFPFSVRAVFTDGAGPGIAQPTVVHSSVLDRTVTVIWNANEAVTGFHVLASTARLRRRAGTVPRRTPSPRARTPCVSAAPTSRATWAPLSPP